MDDFTSKTSDTQQPKKLIGCFRILLFLVLLIGGTLYFVIPNLLGGGPSVRPNRESNAKSTLGAVNRGQQGYYTEYQQFAQTFDDLEKIDFSISGFKREYYVFGILGGEHQGLFVAYGINNQKNGTRDYVGGINFNVDKKEFNTIICRINNKENNYRITNPHTVITNYGEVSDKNSDMECKRGDKVRG